MPQSVSGELLPKLEEVFDSAWLNRVKEAKQFSMGNVEEIHKVIEDLNTKATQTGYEFHLQPVINGVVPPNVAPYYVLDGKLVQPFKYETTGPVVQAMLDSLPPSIREGRDQFFEVHQIRLHEFGSIEEIAAATTTLLVMYLHCKHEGGQCYLFLDDPESHENWKRLQAMHQKHFPQLPSEN